MKAEWLLRVNGVRTQSFIRQQLVKTRAAAIDWGNDSEMCKCCLEGFLLFGDDEEKAVERGKRRRWIIEYRFLWRLQYLLQVCV